MFKSGSVKNTIVAAVFMAAMSVMAVHTRAEQEALIPTQALDAFESWADEFLAAPESERLTLEARGIELAIARKPVFVQLIETDPEQALKRAVPPATNMELPKAIRAHLEEHIDAEGVLQTWIMSGLDGSREAMRTVTIGDKTYRAFTYGRLNDPGFDNKLMPIRGILLEGRIAISDISPSVVDPVAMASEASDADPGITQSPYTESPKTVLYIPVYFTDQTNGPSLTDMDAVDAFLRANSYDKVGVTTTFAPAMQLSKPSTEYTNGTLPFLEVRDEARAIALANGYDYSAYDWSIVRYNGGPGDFGGVAGVGGNDSMLKTAAYGTSAHELGHCLGLWHANYWETTDGTTIGSGRNVEYGNSFDVMGPASMVPQGHFNASHKNKLNWIPATNVTAVTNSGTYRIYAHDLSTFSSSNQYAITVVKDAKRTYWLEYRQHPGWTNQPWVMNGVTLLWAPWGENVSTTTNGSNRGSQLLDTTPGSDGGKQDAPIVIGRTFSDADAGVHVTLKERGGTGSNLWADVVVNVGSFEGNVAPTLSLTASTLTPTTNEVVTFTATAGDSNGDELSYHWDLGDGSFASATSTVTRSWTNTGSRRVTCMVSDMKGGAAVQYAYVNVVNAGTYAISGSIATTNGPLAGVVVSDGTRSAISDSLGHYVILNVTNGSYTLNPILLGASFSPASRNVMVADASLINQDFVATIISPPANGPGTGIIREWWLGIPGMTVGSLTGSAAYAGTPDGMVTETNYFEAPLNWGTDYGQRMQGAFVAPESGNYNFYISSDDRSELWLSTDASAMNLVKIASVDAWSNSREWDKYPSQKSADVAMVAGQRYYIMALHKEGTGGDHLAVGVRYPGGAIEMPIPCHRLEPPVTITATDAFAAEAGQDPGIWTISRSGDTSQVLTVNFSLSGTATEGDDYTLSSADFVTIPAGQTSVTITLTPIDDSVVNEGDETAVLTITAGAGYVISVSPSASITIADNDYVAPAVYAGMNQAVGITNRPPRLWTPSAISVDAWYDAADASTITESGGSLSQWDDKSGNHYNATQSTPAAQPAVNASTLNGKPVLTLDGSNDFLNLDLDYLAGVSHSAFIVTKTVQYSNIYGAANGSAGSGSLHVGFLSTSNYRVNYWGNDYLPAKTSNFKTGTANILNYVWIPGTGKRVYANGFSEGTNTSAGTISAMSGGGRISNVVGHGYYGGDIAEIIMVTGAVSDTDRQKLEGYLAHKWGLVANLPAGHTYKTNAPMTEAEAAAEASLNASVTTGGGALLPQITWSLESSSPTGLAVTFDDPTAEDPIATFRAPGIYTLRLTADDGVTQVSDTVVITVIDESVATNTFNGTPYSWLRLFGITNSYEASDLIDLDGDGALTWEEYRAGTIPTNSESYFHIMSITTPGATPQLVWYGTTNSGVMTDFIIYRATNLLSMDWVPVGTNVRSATGTNIWFDTNPSAGRAYYKVLVSP